MTVLISGVRGQKSSQFLTALSGLLIIREHKSFLEEGKFIVGGASVVCVVSHCCTIFMVFGIM